LRVELSGDHYAELREGMNGNDRRAARAAIEITINGDESRQFTAEMEDKIMTALLRRMILSWTLPQSLPRDAVSPEVAGEIIGNLPIEDVDALYDAVRPHYDRVIQGPKKKIISGSVLPTTSSGDLEQPALS
jgi:hypothetical protein